MQSIKLTLATLALLLTACSPSFDIRWPTATSETPVADTANATATPALPDTTPLATVESPPTQAVAQETPTLANVTNAISVPTATAVATTILVPTATVAATPAGVAAALSQGQEYENLASPVDLVASYYDAVNQQDYERAYSYWQEPPLDYASFASGYAETANVQVIVQPPTRIEGAAGSLYVEIPSVLIAQHRDGSVHTFAGCIVTRRSNLGSPDSAEAEPWHLYQARLAEVANNAAIPTLLAAGCAS